MNYSIKQRRIIALLMLLILGMLAGANALAQTANASDASMLVIEKRGPLVSGGDLCDDFEKPAVLRLRYTGDGPDATSHSQDPSKVTVTGDPSDNPNVYIIVAEKANGSGKIYFSGNISLGGSFEATGAAVGDSEFRSETYVLVYDPQGGALLQTIRFHTSCSQPLEIGDQFGSIALEGFTDKNGNGPAGELLGGAVFSISPNPYACLPEAAGAGALTIADNQPTITAGTLILPGDADPTNGIIKLNGVCSPESYVVTEMNAPVGYRLNGDPLNATFTGDGQTVRLVVENEPINPYTSMLIIEKRGPTSHIGDLCDNFEKPAVLRLTYTGDGPNATSHSQDPSKVTVTGDPNDDPNVYIIVAEKADGSGKIYFSGNVALGGSFEATAAAVGDSEFRSQTYVLVYDSQGGALLQTIRFHTSCSQPLEIGDQFGSISLEGFTDKNGNGPRVNCSVGPSSPSAPTPTPVCLRQQAPAPSPSPTTSPPSPREPSPSRATLTPPTASSSSTASALLRVTL